MPLYRRLLTLLLTSLAVLLVVPSPASASAADDYPYRLDQTGSADPWGFARRQCVSFVAWRLEQRRAPLVDDAEAWGDAAHWDEAAAGLGWRAGTRPVVGAVAQWNAQERSAYYPGESTHSRGVLTAGSVGHVGYVRAVYADGSASVEQYNLAGDRRYSVLRLRAPRYLYVGVRADA